MENSASQEMTEKEFFEHIDAALAQHNIDTAKILELQERMRLEKDANALMELTELTLPAFISLTEEGFTRYDLAG